MTGAGSNVRDDILTRRFRANPRFTLVEHGGLTRAEQELLAGLADRPNHYGVLVPDDGIALGIQAIDAEGAALFSAMGEAGPLPHFITEQAAGSDMKRRIALLVLDGVLEIETSTGQASGPLACGVIFVETEAAALPEPKSTIPAISLAALRRAQHLPIVDPQQLSAWLYAYNTIPVGPRWARRLRSRHAVGDWLGAGLSSSTRRLLDDHYMQATRSGWSSWEHRSTRIDFGDADQPTFKVYVSPRPEALGDAFPSVVRHMVEHQVPAFKTGLDAHGLLRPDKLMAYFNDHASLAAFTAVLIDEVAGLPAQGVPFTAEVHPSGILSWGIDPPRRERVRGLPGSESWRVWLTAKLARSLLTARVEGATKHAWRFALNRVRLEGIDPATWLPAASLWTEMSES